MKTTKFLNIRVLSVAVLAIMSLSSCLKDPRYVDFSSSPALIEFPWAGYNTYATTRISIFTSATGHTKTTDASNKYTFQVAVNLAYATTMSRDIHVTVGVDNSLFTAAAPSTASTSLVAPPNTTTPFPTYYPLPAAAYSLSATTVTIPAGQHLGYFNCTIDANQIPNSNLALTGGAYRNYAIRFVLKDGDGVQLSNYNAVVYQVVTSL